MANKSPHYTHLEYPFDKRWPDTLPSNWVFPPPPVSSGLWNERDWVRYAAPHNRSKWDDTI